MSLTEVVATFCPPEESEVIDTEPEIGAFVNLYRQRATLSDMTMS